MMPEGKEMERIWPFLCANNKTIRRIFSQFMLSIKVSQHFFFFVTNHVPSPPQETYMQTLILLSKTFSCLEIVTVFSLSFQIVSRGSKIKP